MSKCWAVALRCGKFVVELLWACPLVVSVAGVRVVEFGSKRSVTTYWPGSPVSVWYVTIFSQQMYYMITVQCSAALLLCQISAYEMTYTVSGGALNSARSRYVKSIARCREWSLFSRLVYENIRLNWAEETEIDWLIDWLIVLCRSCWNC